MALIALILVVQPFYSIIPDFLVMRNISAKFLELPLKVILFWLRHMWWIWGGLALLGGHILTIYRNPGHEVTIVWDSLYLGWLSFWSILLWISQLCIVYAVRYFFYRRRKGISALVLFLSKSLLFFIILLLVFPFLLVQLFALIPHEYSADYWKPGCVDIELGVLCSWLFAYATFLVFYHAFRSYMRKERQLVIASQRSKLQQMEIMRLNHSEDIEATFMLIRKGDTGYRLKNNGMFVKDFRRAKDMKEILEGCYDEISKGINLHRDYIVKLDEEENKAYLVADKLEILRKMVQKYPELQNIQDAIKSKHGLLYLSPAMCRKIMREREGE